MEKLVIIINGKGGSGKDTLCDFAGRRFKVKNVSAITPIKDVAGRFGWNGEKDGKSRKFLADLKQACVEYNDLPFRYLAGEYGQFLEGSDDLMFVHIREGEEIDKFKRIVKLPCVTLFVSRKERDGLCLGNASDDGVKNYQYDYEYRNDKGLSEAEEDFLMFLEDMLKKEEEAEKGRRGERKLEGERDR
ncbi:MAG: hypothetical protein HFI66_04605 [Lachnospiraceae bacterium]|nr:hypothetical protein [Lachnospiraceae bacterium]